MICPLRRDTSEAFSGARPQKPNINALVLVLRAAIRVLPFNSLRFPKVFNKSV
jgi:hypothetical protein